MYDPNKKFEDYVAEGANNTLESLQCLLDGNPKFGGVNVLPKYVSLGKVQETSAHNTIRLPKTDVLLKSPMKKGPLNLEEHLENIERENKFVIPSSLERAQKYAKTLTENHRKLECEIVLSE